MSDNKYPHKAFVFISQTDGSSGAEYYKYRFQGMSACAPNPKRDFEWRFSVPQRTLRVLMHKRSQEWLGKSGWEQLGYGGNEPTHKLADAIDAGSRDAEGNSNQIFGVNGTIRKMLSAFYKDVIYSFDVANLNSRQLELDNLPCTIFMHWGGGERPRYRNREIFIQKHLPVGWKFFSIGTQRNELFNVDGSTIVIPDRKGLEDLEQRLEMSNTANAAIAPLTKIATGSNALTDDERIKVESEVIKLKECILKSSLDTQSKERLLVAIGELISAKNGPFSDKVTLLARKILNKEVFNG